MRQRREIAIDRANKQMHDQQDQVKAFHSKMMLCDTMQEREAQLKLKKKKEKFDQEIEKQWVEKDKEKMEEYDRKLREKLE